MRKKPSFLAVLGGLAIAAVASGQARAANFTTLVSFCALADCADGTNPFAGLIADARGNLFGTTLLGGANGDGTAFEIVKTAAGYAGTATTLVSFCSRADCADGQSPEGSLILDARGNLFGTTQLGGSNGAGTVFEIAKTASVYASAPTTLVSFSGADGLSPGGALIFDANGDLFGTTAQGGTGTFPGGTVFEIVKTAGGYASTPITLINFCSSPNCIDGGNPHAGLIADAGGNLFGTANFGGANGEGTVFEIVKTAGGYASTPTTLVSFCSLANCADGRRPESSLIFDANGNLFGTTAGGPFPIEMGGAGTVFEIVKTATGYAGTATTLVSFCSLANCADGEHPDGSLLLDANGNLFGTTQEGGTNGAGTVFEIVRTASGYANTPTVLVNFNGANGAQPLADLIADANGNLFSTTDVGGANSGGTVFEVTGSGFAAPHKFAGTPGKPNCHGQSVAALARKYGGLKAAAKALGYASVQALQNAIMKFCKG